MITFTSSHRTHVFIYISCNKSSVSLRLQSFPHHRCCQLSYRIRCRNEPRVAARHSPFRNLSVHLKRRVRVRLSPQKGKGKRTRGETSTLRAAIPCKPTLERCSRESKDALEGRKREKHVATRCSRLMIDTKGSTKDKCTMYVEQSTNFGTEPGL